MREGACGRHAKGVIAPEKEVDMFIVDMLYSRSLGKHYVGQTSDLNSRLQRHNAGLVKSTKSGVPWEVKCSFEVASRSEAVLLEQRIKKRGAKRYLDDISGINVRY
jgi:putative endonuclease